MNAQIRVLIALACLAACQPGFAQTTTTISALPTATAPLADSELAPVVQSGTTKKATVAQIKAAYRGISAPSAPIAGQLWFDTNTTSWVLKQYDGAQWAVLGTLDTVAHTWITTGTSLMPVQTNKANGSTCTASCAFAASDLQYETRRSNSGSAMTDTFPASTVTGMINGARITINNFDTTASDTITAGSGTTFSGGSTFVVPASRSITFVYDAGATPTPTWRSTFNTSTTVIGPATAVSGNLPSFADTTGKVVGDSGVAVTDLITNNTTSGVVAGTYGSSTRCVIGLNVLANGLVAGVGDSTSCPGGGGGGGSGTVFAATSPTNTGNAYSAAATGYSLVDGYIVSVKAPANNTGASTANFNSTGAKPIQVFTAGVYAALVGGEIQQNARLLLQYDAVCDCDVLLNPAGSATRTIGSVPSSAQITADFSTGCADYKVTSSGVTIPLPAAASLSGNGCIIVEAIGHDVTMSLVSGTDTFNSGTAGASLVLKNGTFSKIGSDQTSNFTVLSMLTVVDLSGSQATGTLAAARMPALTGDVTSTAGSTVTTLPNVNSNVGTFGDASHCASVTVNAKGQVTAASQSTSCPGAGGGGGSGETPSYIASNWYAPERGGAQSNGGTVTAGTMYARRFYVPTAITISALAARVTTLGTSNVQLAVYAANANGSRPTGTALCATGDIANTSAAAISANCAGGNVSLAAGYYFYECNTNDSTAVYQIVSAANSNQSWSLGSATLSTVTNSGAIMLTGLRATQTYGTWPDETSTTWTENNNTAGATVFFKVASVP